MITTDQLRRWSEALCRLEHAEPKATIAALGLTGYIEESPSFVASTPPPGARTARFARSNDKVDFVEFTFLEPKAAPTSSSLDAAFGTPGKAPLLAGPPLLVQHLYRIAIPGAPFTCTIIAAYSTVPLPADAPHTIKLRRDRAS